MNPIKFNLPLPQDRVIRSSMQQAEQDSPLEQKRISLDFLRPTQNQNAQVINSRKSAASARMAELKARIENMMRFSFIGKGNPRMVAELARELKALVAQYGGTSGGVGQMMAPTQNASTSTADAGGVAGTGEAEAATKGADAAQTAQAAQVAAQANSAAAGAEKTEKTHPQDKDGESKSAQPTIQTKQGNSGDGAFFTEAKRLAQMLKHLLALENRKLKTEADQRDYKAAKQGIRDVESEIQKAQEAVANEHAAMGQDSGATYDASGTASASTNVSVSVFA